MEHMHLVQIIDSLQDLKHNAFDVSQLQLCLHVDDPLQIVLQVLKHQVEGASLFVLFRC